MTTTYTEYLSALATVNHVILGAGSAPSLKNLANGSGVVGSEVDNSGGGKPTMAMFQLKCRGASAFTAGTTVDLYFLTALDGTNYEDGSASVFPSSVKLVHSFGVRAVSTQQIIDTPSPGILLPPCKFKPLIVNNGGQAFTNTDAENLLDMYTYSPQIVG